jgi:hypothetical protein
MTSTRGALPPTLCTACSTNLAGHESHITEWRPGTGITYWCHDCDPRKADA